MKCASYMMLYTDTRSRRVYHALTSEGALKMPISAKTCKCALAQ